MSNIENDRVTYWNDTQVWESPMQPHTLGYVQKVIRNMRPAVASFDRVPDVVYDLRVKGSLHIFYHPETK